MLTTEKDDMRVAEKLAVAFYVCVAIASLYMYSKVVTMEPRLPCAVAEISPDFSQADREKCRVLRSHKM